jgi:hypothetical protein
MRRFSSITVQSIIIICLFCFASIIYGRQAAQSKSLQKLGLFYCMDDFCIANIKPTTTKWELTEQILLNQSNTGINTFHVIKSEPSSVIVVPKSLSEPTNSEPDFELHFWKDHSSGLTNFSVISTNKSGLLRLHELVNLLGPPCTLAVSDDGIYLEYPLIVGEISINSQKSMISTAPLSPQTYIHSLSVWSEKNNCNLPFVVPASFNTQFRWCGFASWNYYLHYCLKKFSVWR